MHKKDSYEKLLHHHKSENENNSVNKITTMHWIKLEIISHLPSIVLYKKDSDEKLLHHHKSGNKNNNYVNKITTMH